MVHLKRIKNKEDLVDVLSYLIEDINTFKFLKNHKDISDLLTNAKERLK